MFSEVMRYEYPLNADSVVFDVGLHKGTFSEEISRRYGCHVHAFEPVDEFREEAIRRLAPYPKVKIHSVAIGLANSQTTIEVRGDTSGFFTEERTNGQQCNVITLDEFLRYYEIPQIDLLKLNVEGSEYGIVERLTDTGLISRVVDLQVQWHRNVEDYAARYADIAMDLRRTHESTYREPWIWENWRRL